MRTCIAEANVYFIQNAKLVAITSCYATSALLTQNFAPKLGDKYVWIQDEAHAELESTATAFTMLHQPETDRQDYNRHGRAAFPVPIINLNCHESVTI